MRTGIKALLVLATALAAAAAHAEQETERGITRNPSALSDSELDARLRFLEERLDGGKKFTQYWQWGWTAIYGAGIPYGVTRAVTTDSPNSRVQHIVTAAKSAIGTARLVVWRHPGRHGADPMREIEGGDTREAKLARLEEGEALLKAVAERATHRTSWKSHAGNLALNLAGGGFILGFGCDSDVLESVLVGVGVGELNIWTAPKRGIQDLSDYETRFGMKTASRFDWAIVPTAGGAAIQVRF
ncbi:MAG TPA: hypothetical protein VEC18_03390 [Myxococcota bacterium]|nr:hypothetical protein [Myxococcota bacterium]